jgi:flagellar hook-length control protein FliK
MTTSLMTNLINDISSGSIQGNFGSKTLRSKNSDQEEHFRIPSPENQSQESQKSQKTDSSQGTSGKKSDASQTDDNKDGTKVDLSLSNNPAADSSAQINSMVGSVPPPADPATDKPDPLKSAKPCNNLLMSADMKLLGNDVTLSNQKLPSLGAEELKTTPGNQFAIGDQGKTDTMTIKLNEVNGKTIAIPADMEPVDNKDQSLLDKSTSDLTIKGAVGEKSGNENESSGDSAPEGNLSDQSGSAGPLSLVPLNKPQEGALNQSFSAIHQNEGGLNSALLSNQDLPPDEEQVLRQLTGWLSSHRSNELQSIRLNLSPESLGTIQVDLSVQNQQVKADIVASSAQVKELLEKHQDLLRNGLADNGLRVDQFTVRLEGPASYQAEGSMNFNNRFFQRENQPTGHFLSHNAPVTTFTPNTSPVDLTGGVSGNSQGGISIYI